MSHPDEPEDAIRTGMRRILHDPRLDARAELKKLVSEGPAGVGPPQDTASPMFVYGTLKSDELGHHWIKHFVVGEPQPDSVAGRLLMRDGIPLLSDAGSGRVLGEVLRFRAGEEDEAYRQIGAFEPRAHYTWKHATTVGGVCAWVLLGRKADRGTEDWEHGGTWTCRRDPMFNEAMQVIGDVIERDGSAEFGNFLDSPEWSRFFRLQSAYLLLWSVLERYTTLSFGPSLQPMARISKLGSDALFVDAVSRLVTREDTVFDSRGPDDKHSLDPKKPAKAWNYYYQVRSNLSHRGKASWKDGNRLQRSLIELYALTKAVIPTGGTV